MHPAKCGISFSVFPYGIPLYTKTPNISGMSGAFVYSRVRFEFYYSFCFGGFLPVAGFPYLDRGRAHTVLFNRII